MTFRSWTRSDARRAAHPAACLLLAACLLTSCATGSGTQNAGDTAGAEDDSLGAQAASDTVPGIVFGEFRAPAGVPAPSLLSWAQNGHLRLGFADGKGPTWTR